MTTTISIKAKAELKRDPCYAEALFCAYMKEKYAPFGPGENRVFRTSSELAYEFREMEELSLPVINRCLTELQYKSGLFCGQPIWLLYEKQET